MLLSVRDVSTSGRRLAELHLLTLRFRGYKNPSLALHFNKETLHVYRAGKTHLTSPLLRCCMSTWMPSDDG